MALGPIALADSLDFTIKARNDGRRCARRHPGTTTGSEVKAGRQLRYHWHIGQGSGRRASTMHKKESLGSWRRNVAFDILRFCITLIQAKSNSR